MATRLLLKDLAEQKQATPIDIIVASYEGSLYQAFVQVGDQEFLIWQDQDTPLKTHNLLSMREKLTGITVAHVYLRQDSAYDEMIGQEPRTAPNTLKLKLDAMLLENEGDQAKTF